MQDSMAQDSAFNILALDGGGTRGVYSAQVLACIEQETGAPYWVPKHFYYSYELTYPPFLLPLPAPQVC